MAARSRNRSVRADEQILLIIKNEIMTHRKALADVDPALVGGGHSGTLPVVHIAGHVSRILAELQLQVRAVPSRGQGPAVVQLTAAQETTRHTERLEMNLRPPAPPPPG